MTASNSTPKDIHPLVAWLDSDDPCDRHQVGNKASLLSRIARTKLRCAPGCCLTVAAWKRYLDHNRFSLDSELQELGADQDAINAIRDKVFAGSMPPDLEAELLAVWHALEARATWTPLRVAVRSSGIAEDLADASFAGLYATIINVPDFESLKEAIKICWASILNDRVLTYRRSRANRISYELGVIIQELVPSAVAGTAFSANPLTGRRDEIQIDSSWGLGEAVVSGRVSPDHFVVRVVNGHLTVTVRNIRRKSTTIVPLLDGGTLLLETEPEKANAPSLTDSQSLDIASAVQTLAGVFHEPQDVEWAIADDKLYILQARPMTALPVPIDAGISWTFVVKKRLSWFSEMIQVEGIKRHYYQTSLGLDFEFRNAKMVRFHEYLDGEELDALSELLDSKQRHDPMFLERLATQSYNRCDELSAYVQGLQGVDFARMTNGGIVSMFTTFVHHMLMLIPVIYTEPNLEKRILNYLESRLPGSDAVTINDDFVILTSTSKELTILKEQRDLLRIAAMIQGTPALMRGLESSDPMASLRSESSEIGGLLEKHRREFSWINTDDVYGHPWSIDDFIERLRYLVSKQDCKERLEQAILREEERNKAYDSLIALLDPDEATRRLLEVARMNSHLRTYRAEVYVRSMFEASGLITEIGHRLGLEHGEVVCLSHYEIISALSSGARSPTHEIMKRRNGTAYIVVNGTIHAFFGEDAWRLPSEEPGAEEAGVDASDIIRGMTANTGRVKGVVRIVHDISELHKVATGDVIVASMTIPEFAPALERASAFVTNEGGITCHAAIISREMGVPCIIGTGNATIRLMDGDLVEVDASGGFVKVLKRGSDGAQQ